MDLQIQRLPLCAGASPWAGQTESWLSVSIAGCGIPDPDHEFVLVRAVKLLDARRIRPIEASAPDRVGASRSRKHGRRSATAQIARKHHVPKEACIQAPKQRQDAH